MKSFSHVFTLVFAIVLFAFSQSAHAQCCNCRKIKVEMGDKLKPYMYEMYNAKEVNLEDAYDPAPIEGSFTVYEGENYRVLFNTKNIPGNVTVKIYDGKSNMLYTNENEPSIDYFDFTAGSTQDCYIKFFMPMPDETFVGVGCLVYMLGSKF